MDVFRAVCDSETCSVANKWGLKSTLWYNSWQLVLGARRPKKSEMPTICLSYSSDRPRAPRQTPRGKSVRCSTSLTFTCLIISCMNSQQHNICNDQMCERMLFIYPTPSHCFFFQTTSADLKSQKPLQTPSIMQRLFFIWACERDLFMLMAAAGLIVFSWKL